MNLILLVALIISCVVIFIYFGKKQMVVARAFFLAAGVFACSLSSFLLFADSLLYNRPQSLENLSLWITYLLAISNVVFDLSLIVVSVATFILSVLAIRKIAEYIGQKKPQTEDIFETEVNYNMRQVYFLPQKLYILHCRLIN